MSNRTLAHHTTPLVAVLAMELRIHEILRSFRGGLGDLMGHLICGMPGVYVIYGYPRDYKTYELIDYLAIPGAHLLCRLDVDIYYPSVRRQVRVVAVKRNKSMLYILWPHEGELGGRIEGDILYPGDSGLALEQAAFFGRAAQALLMQRAIKPDIVSLQEWRAACTAMPSMLVNPFFARTKYLYVNHTARREALPIFDERWYPGLAIDDRFRFAFVHGGGIDVDRGCVALSHMTAGVSEEHADVLRQQYPEHAHKIVGVLNGLDRAQVLSPRLRGTNNPSNAQLHRAHQGDKKDLLEFIASRSDAQWTLRDPVLSAVRRIAYYKYQYPILRTIIHDMVATGQKVFIGGVPHENDTLCRDWVGAFNEWMRDKELKKGFVYIPEYGEHVRMLAARGSDQWLECPLPREEACGTSDIIAWVNGNPVIATCGGGAREYGTQIDPSIAAGDTLFIEPYTPEKLLENVRQMRRWYEDARLWAQLRRNAFEKGRTTDVRFMVERYRERCFKPLMRPSLQRVA